MEQSKPTSVDSDEVARFAALAADWWNPRGKFKPLHRFNPVRIGYIREIVCEHFSRDTKSATPFSGLRFLDIGCGGGLLSEPMARLGADVTGADPAVRNIEAARIHAANGGLEIDYRTDTAEELSDAGETFDVVLNMEVVEHVADVPLFMAACSGMVRPGGLMFVATINRTRKAQALAIVAAERILRWLPVGTHQYEKLVKPEEIEAAFRDGGLTKTAQTGVFYNPVLDRWNRSGDMDVNYMLVGART